ncbi:MAG: Asp-tRNA(Asn)/Glu-tRNA(Gln) amidotransferase subunit GatC [Planctomycetaceae bacterium]|nr:Asp-tRNA(Asn)/Glu-tRNA(Gln) amidotransferase subunit GatC [Planctomycetaceae bacterium]
MSLSQEDVKKVASLSRLALSEKELAQMQEHLGQILDYFEILQEVDTENVEPMAHAIELHNVFREDEIRESLPREEALANAPKTDGKYFLVPEILRQDK